MSKNIDNLNTWKETCLTNKSGYGISEQDPTYEALVEYEKEQKLIAYIKSEIAKDRNTPVFKDNKLTQNEIDKVHKILKSQFIADKISIGSIQNILEYFKCAEKDNEQVL